MNFFGIGGWEWAIIAIAALVVFGPGKLPEVAGQAGKAVRDFRRMTTDLTGEFEKSLNESGAGELRKTFDKELRGMRGQVESVGKSVERDLKKGGASATSAKKSTSTSSKSSTAVKKATGKAASTGSGSARAAASGKGGTAAKAANSAVVERKASKADPLADVSFMADDTESQDSAPPRRAAAASKQAGNRAKTSGSPDGSALARVRERRSTAGYSRARVS